MSLRVNVIEPVGGHGGMNYYNSGLANGIAANGGIVHLYTCDRTREVSSGPVNIEKNFRKIWGSGNKVLRFLRFIRGTVSSTFAMKRRGDRFCHLHFFEYNLKELMPCLALKIAGLKIIATVHDIEAFSKSENNLFQHLMFKLVDEYIVHNAFSCESLISATKGKIVREKINIIHHGNYLPYIKTGGKSEARRELGLDENNPVVLFFGQIKQVKGLDILLEALPQVLLENPDTKLLIAGKVWKDNFDAYEKIISTQGIEGSIIKRVEYIPDEDVHLFYNAADVIVIPYRNIYQSGVLLMAMSYGAVTLSSDLAPMKEIVIDGHNGFLFETGSRESLANNLNRILAMDTNNISREAIRTMQESYDWSQIGKQHLEVYKRYVN